MVGHCCDGVYCGVVVDLLDVVLQAAAGVGGCDECPEAFAFQELVDQVLGWKVGCVKGGAVYANLVPMEDDCNATASLFVRGRHPGQVEAILDSGGRTARTIADASGQRNDTGDQDGLLPPSVR